MTIPDTRAARSLRVAPQAIWLAPFPLARPVRVRANHSKGQMYAPLPSHHIRPRFRPTPAGNVPGGAGVERCDSALRRRETLSTKPAPPDKPPAAGSKVETSRALHPRRTLASPASCKQIRTRDCGIADTAD